MRNLRLKLGGIVVVVAGIGGNAAAQDPPVADDPAAPKSPDAQPPSSSEDEPVSCPTPPVVAQQGPTTVPMGQPAPQPMPAEAEVHHDWLHDTGLAIALGGGVDDFVGSTMRDTTGVGGSWNARLTLGTRSFIAGEVSYIGSAQSITSLGLASNSELIGNGAQVALRLNGTIDYGVQPFAFGGAAWRHYSLNTSSPNLSDVRDTADAFEVPLGIGIAGYISGVVLEARGEYRFGWTDHDIVPTVTGGSPTMDRWGVTGNIGYEF